MAEQWRNKILSEINSRVDLMNIYAKQPPKLQEFIIRNFIDISAKAQQTIIELRDRMPVDGLVQSILMTDERLLTELPPLKMHYLKIETEKKTHEFHETIAYLTDRRLIIVDAKRDDIPVMKETTLPEDPKKYAIALQRVIKDRVFFLPISLSDIYNVQLNVSNESITGAYVYLQKYMIIALLGAMLGILGGLALWPSPTALVAILLGFILVIVGLVYSSPKVRYSAPVTVTTRQLGIMAYDPWFKEKSSITMNVYEDIPLSVLLRWVSEFQTRCPLISQAR